MTYGQRGMAQSRNAIHRPPQRGGSVGLWSIAEKDRRCNKSVVQTSRQGSSVAIRINGQKRNSSGVVRELMHIVGFE